MPPSRGELESESGDDPTHASPVPGLCAAVKGEREPQTLRDAEGIKSSLSLCVSEARFRERYGRMYVKPRSCASASAITCDGISFTPGFSPAIRSARTSATGILN
jgi:hypothetical protein